MSTPGHDLYVLIYKTDKIDFDTPTEKLVYIYLRHHWMHDPFEDGGGKPRERNGYDYEHMASKCICTLRTILKCLSSLEKKGYIKRIKRYDQDGRHLKSDIVFLK